jgi:hypothetical protein
MIQKSIVALLGVLVALLGVAGCWFSVFSDQPWDASKVPALLLFACIAVTGIGLLVFAFRQSMAGFWLLNVSIVSTIWLNALAHLTVRDASGLSNVSFEEWLRMGIGAVLIAGFAVLASRSHRRSRAARATT